MEKSVQAAEKHKVKAMLISGGVSANQALCTAIAERAGDIPVYYPPKQLCTDNAAMIAAAGYRHYEAGQQDGWSLDARPTWPLM
jgi:N6-L-threonylcarbamoyladenine synthase